MMMMTEELMSRDFTVSSNEEDYCFKNRIFSWKRYFRSLVVSYKTHILYLSSFLTNALYSLSEVSADKINPPGEYKIHFVLFYVSKYIEIGSLLIIVEKT